MQGRNDSRDTQPLPEPAQAEAESSQQDFPARIGPYKIESLLQSGGMSLLYLATDIENNEPVVVKVLRPKFLNQKDVIAHFLREAKVMGLVDHPNVVSMKAHGTWEGGHYIAMEFITGISLRHYLLHYPLSLKKSLEIILEIAHGICHLHTHGIIHRDLKLENVLLSDRGSVKIIDFGIAQLIDEVKDEDRNLWYNRTLGTPIYMSPEQRENPESVSYPSDIYSLGIIAYELALGRLSHGHVHLALMPKGLQKILAKALQPQPLERYQDIVDFISDMTHYINSENLQNERKIGDRISELFEEFQQINDLLLPKKIPEWKGLNIGFSVDPVQVAIGGYADFFELDDHHFLLLAGESISDNAEKAVLQANMRGTVRALAHLQYSPKELVAHLNKLLEQDPFSKPFALCLLLISLRDHEVSFVSCGFGYLWMIEKGGVAARPISERGELLNLSSSDTKYKQINLSFRPGDQIVLFGSQQCTVETSQLLVQGMIEFSDLGAQQKADSLLRKLKLFADDSCQRSLYLLKFNEREQNAG